MTGIAYSAGLSRDLFQGSLFNALTLVVAIVAVVVTTVAAYYQRRNLLPPRKRLSVTWLQPAPILSKDTTSKGIRVIHGETTLSDPYLTTISVANTGKRDIGSGEFDQQRPVTIHLGVPIAKIIDASGKPGKKPLPQYAMSGSDIQVGPDLLPRKQVLILQVLTDGEPTVECMAFLANVKVEVKKQPPPTQDRLDLLLAPPLRALVLLVWLVVLGFVMWPQLTVTVESSPPPRVADPPPMPVPSDPATIDAYPESAAPGARITVSGSGFAASSIVDIALSCPVSPSGDLTTTANASTNETGSFGAELTLPNDSRMPSPAPCTIRAQQAQPGGIEVAVAIVTVKAQPATTVTTTR